MKLQGSPSLDGVRYVGSIHHQGGGPGQGTIPPFDSTEDLAFNHETELTGSGQHPDLDRRARRRRGAAGGDLHAGR